MATVTDLTKNSVTAADNSSTQIPEDSNLNVYEFGNLILADILPTLASILNLVADYFGDLVSATDISGDSLSEEDTTGTSLTTTDFAGESSSVTDLNIPIIEDSNINAFEFANILLAGILPTVLQVMGYLLDRSGSSIESSDVIGSSVDEAGLIGTNLTTTDKAQNNSIEYDDSAYTYEDTRINYDGYVFTGTVMDISGT